MYLFGEPNSSIEGGEGRPTWPQHLRDVRAAVFKRGESIGYDPKPGDLGVGKAKRAERYVEAC